MAENEEYIKDWVRQKIAPEYTLKNKTLVKESNGNSQVTSFARQLHNDLKKASKSNHYKEPGKVDYAFEVKSNDKYHISNSQNTYLVIIETKKDINLQRYIKYKKLDMHSKATIKYAENGAVWYAKCIQRAQSINQQHDFPRIFAIGISGNENIQKVQPYYVAGDGTVTKAKTSFPGVNNLAVFKPDYIDEYYRVAIENESPYNLHKTKDYDAFVSDLHNDIRNYTSLRNEQKAPLIAGILLSLYSGNLHLDELKGYTDADTSDGEKIFHAIKSFLDKKVTTTDNRFSYEEDRALLNSFNFIRTDKSLYKPRFDLNYHSPLYHFVERLRRVETQISDSENVDVLGYFYDEFVKYDDKDGNDLGIVLTPRHITQLMAELINIHFGDHVLDTVAGSGSFLISAMAEMNYNLNHDPNISPQKISSDKAYIMNHSLYGVEKDPTIYSVAVSNMILRGDGNSNIINGNSFDIPNDYGRKFNINKILMNPPYSQGKKGDKGEPEIDFIRHAIDILNSNKSKRPWELAAIIPISAVVSGGKGVSKSKFGRWKQYLCDNCQIKSIITMNPQTFYPKGTQTVIIILRSSSNGNNKPTQLINYNNDGYDVIPKHGLIIPNKNMNYAKAQRKKLKDTVLGKNINPIPNGKFIQRVQLTPTNAWLFNAHYTNPNPPKDIDFKKTVADYLTFKTNMQLHGRGYLFKGHDKNA